MATELLSRWDRRTEVTEDGKPASLSEVRIPSAVRVENFLKAWTAGTVTAVQPDSVVLLRLDGANRR